MANERTVPLLPCASIDDIRDFMVPLGFAVTEPLFEAVDELRAALPAGPG